MCPPLTPGMDVTVHPGDDADHPEREDLRPSAKNVLQWTRLGRATLARSPEWDRKRTTLDLSTGEADCSSPFLPDASWSFPTKSHQRAWRHAHQ